MSRTNLKRYLMLLAVVGLVAIAAGGSGTFASFNAQVTNPGNTFASGTLFLHDQPNGGTWCTSESDTFNNQGSDTCLILFPSKDLTAGAQTATLDLHNAGKIDAANIQFKVSSCTVDKNTAATGSTVVFGTDPTCADMYITVQETGSNYDTPTNTDVYCAFPTLATTCASPSSGATLASASSFQTLKTTGAATATLNQNTDKYYVITVEPNPTLGSTPTTNNVLQNRIVTFALTWQINQV